MNRSDVANEPSSRFVLAWQRMSVMGDLVV